MTSINAQKMCLEMYAEATIPSEIKNIFNSSDSFSSNEQRDKWMKATNKKLDSHIEHISKVHLKSPSEFLNDPYANEYLLLGISVLLSNNKAWDEFSKTTKWTYKESLHLIQKRLKEGDEHSISQSLWKIFIFFLIHGNEFI